MRLLQQTSSLPIQCFSSKNFLFSSSCADLQWSGTHPHRLLTRYFVHQDLLSFASTLCRGCPSLLSSLHHRHCHYLLTHFYRWESSSLSNLLYLCHLWALLHLHFGSFLVLSFTWLEPEIHSRLLRYRQSQCHFVVWLFVIFHSFSALLKLLQIAHLALWNWLHSRMTASLILWL